MSMLRDKYKNTVVPALKASGKFPSVMDLPKLEKIVVNIGVNALVDRDALKAAMDDIAKITGQRPAMTKATKSISNFKLREGMPIGAKATLRGERMWEFLERLIHATLPRIRDFRGLPNRGFDGRGNYTFGLKDQTTFPEIDATQVPVEKGMDITICTTGDDKAARELLTLLGLPFAGKNKNK